MAPGYEVHFQVQLAENVTGLDRPVGGAVHARHYQRVMASLLQTLHHLLA
jgi:hypothetical protein